MFPRSTQNLLLESVPAHDLKSLSADLELVGLTKNLSLFPPNKHDKFLYFPIDAVVAFFSNTRQGGTIEVWEVGREGVTGTPSLLGGKNPFHGVVVVPGEALKMS